MCFLIKCLGDLPLKSGVTKVTEAESVFGPQLDHVNMAIPQSVVQFGHQGLKRDDKDFIPAYILIILWVVAVLLLV